MWWRKKEKVEGVKVERLPGDSGYVLDVEGQKVVAVKLPTAVAREVAGQAGADLYKGVEGSAKYVAETEQNWLLVTNMHNPLLREYDKLTLLAAQGLTIASGSQIPQSNILVSGGTSVTATCAKCGSVLSPSHTGPCPTCGQEGKAFSLKIDESVNLSGP
jgi:hypothetical protein